MATGVFDNMSLVDIWPEVEHAAGDPEINAMESNLQVDRMQRYRMKRFLEQLELANCDAAILFDPNNMRYLIGTANDAIFLMHMMSQACLVTADGAIFLYGSEEFARRAPEKLAYRGPLAGFCYFYAGPRAALLAQRWAADVYQVLGGRGRQFRVAIDRLNLDGLKALEDVGIQLVNGQRLMEEARRIKSADEILCMRISLAIAETALYRVRHFIRPGVSENQLFSILYYTNISLGGEWIEYRDIASGERINPWGQEACERQLLSGDLVGIDTGLIGPRGYAADISRTFHCGPARPTAEQKALYRQAFHKLHANVDLVKPGMSYRQISERGGQLPPEFMDNCYSQVMHGIGFGDEAPSVPYWQDWDRTGYDGVVQPGMTVCVEIYLGRKNERDGVKLEEQILVTESGNERLSRFPFEEDLLR